MSDIEKIKRFISSIKWRKTNYIKPHEYIIRQSIKGEFDYFAGYIQKFGKRRKFLGKYYIYLKVGGYEYWTIPPVINRRKYERPETD